MEWNNQQVVVHCDNEAAVVVLNSGYSRDPHIMHLLRALIFIKAWYQINMTVCHISSKVNMVADAISRDHLPLLHLQVPLAIPVQWKFPVICSKSWWSNSRTGHQWIGFTCSGAVFSGFSSFNITNLQVGERDVQQIFQREQK